MTTDIKYASGVLTVTRVYDAPREAVFDAWVETSKVQQWWGCGQTTHVKSEVERHVGGKYHHDMTIDGAGVYPMAGVITEYDPPARLAYSVDSPEQGGKMTVCVEFLERNGKTEVRLSHNNLPETLREIVSGGWTAAFDKLNRFLMAEIQAAE